MANGEREGARRRRRRGGRGRNRGEDAGAAPVAVEEPALDAGERDDALSDGDVLATAPVSAPAWSAPAVALPEPLPTTQPIVVASAPIAVASAPIAVPAPAAAVRAEPYRLPIDQLNAVASAAGLEWVHSDDDKVRAAQAAMAAEPKPVHVPREPKPPVAIDDGPLVLVETKKDLAQIKLPFDR
jgi:ribonuclease E